MEKNSNFSLKEALKLFYDPSINSIEDPEQKLEALLLSFLTLETKENVLDSVFDLTRDHSDVDRAVLIGKKVGCRVWG